MELGKSKLARDLEVLVERYVVEVCIESSDVIRFSLTVKCGFDLV